MNAEKPYAVCLTFDFDAMSVWLGGYPVVTPAMLSRGEYGARVAVPRILGLLEEYDVPATFFVPGHTAESFPHAVDSILSAGHEVAHHSYGHEDPSTQTPDEERSSLERALAVLERFLGHPPAGYRSPSWVYSDATLSLLLEHGFLYDSSLFAGDFHPYRPRLGDQVGIEDPLQMGEEVDIWEFPVDFTLDDWAHFTFNFDPLRVGLSAPSKVMEIWAGDFDYMMEREEHGVLTITMHPQVIARGHRMTMLERFIQHILWCESARFARMGDLAQELSAEDAA
ncbi:MAG: polysaccharide deacetylase [Actinobacteria bacterium]|nr:polysaccharide deacetylase [Actinomycetota bacterium]